MNMKLSWLSSEHKRWTVFWFSDEKSKVQEACWHKNLGGAVNYDSKVNFNKKHLINHWAWNSVRCTANNELKLKIQLLRKLKTICSLKEFASRFWVSFGWIQHLWLISTVVFRAVSHNKVMGKNLISLKQAISPHWVLSSFNLFNCIFLCISTSLLMEETSKIFEA